MSSLTPTPVQLQGAATLPQLADPTTYRACVVDLNQSEAERTYWIEVFRSHWPSMLEDALTEALDRGENVSKIQEQIDRVRERFLVYLKELSEDPARDECLTILDICVIREALLREVGIEDPYRLSKERENKVAMAVLPSLLEQLDQMDERARLVQLAQGVFAGNIFDMGANHTRSLFTNGQSVDFRDIRDKLKPRPWLIDDLDLWITRLTEGKPHQGAIAFVDNAGCDVVLGMLPLVRELLSRQTPVIISANTYPSLNDITHEELTVLIAEIASWDPVIGSAVADGRLTLIASGNGLPLIDLTRVSEELALAATKQPIDLVIIEGMGRAMESNLDATFNCDVLKVAMMKDRNVAALLGGTLFDLMFRFEPVAT